VYVGSVPATGHLVALGFEPIRVISTYDSGEQIVVFPSEACEALSKFLDAEQHVDALLCDMATYADVWPGLERESGHAATGI
jgi:hypothetical protein